MIKKIILFLFVILIWCCNSVWAGGDEMILHISLKIKTDKIKCGTLPEFLFTIKNNSAFPIRILNLKRIDLQHAAARIEVHQLPEMLDMTEVLGRMISDPGYISDSDFINIPENGGTLEFILSFSTLPLEALLPGKYVAYIKYKPDPVYKKDGNRYETNQVMFEVIHDKNHSCGSAWDIERMQKEWEAYQQNQSEQ